MTASLAKYSEAARQRRNEYAREYYRRRKAVDPSYKRAYWTAYARKRFGRDPNKPQRRFRKSNPATRAPTTNELYWAAGFVDGEGCFLATTNRRIVVSATQNDAELLERLRDIFGGSINKHDNARRWTVTGSRAVGVMLTLFPLMSEKRKLAIEKALKAHGVLGEIA